MTMSMTMHVNMNMKLGTTEEDNNDKVRRLVWQPKACDVLCGKTKECMLHFGTKRFRAVIETYREGYAQALTKYDKMGVTKEIYDALTEASSRFLKYSENETAWEELSPIAARDKIGHALRFANRETRQRKSGSRSISPTNKITLMPLEPVLPIAAAPAANTTNTNNLIFSVLYGENEVSSSSKNQESVRQQQSSFLPSIQVLKKNYESCLAGQQKQPKVASFDSENMLASSHESTMKLVGETVALLDSVRRSSFDWKNPTTNNILCNNYFWLPTEGGVYDDVESSDSSTGHEVFMNLRNSLCCPRPGAADSSGDWDSVLLEDLDVSPAVFA